MTSGKFKSVSVDFIQVDRASRQRRELTGIEELARSIAAIGLINPPVVRKDGTLVTGERRLTAIKALGWSHVPVQFIEDLPEDEARLVELEENLRRTDLTWQDQCAAIQQYHSLRVAAAPEWTARDTGRALSFSDQKVSQYLSVAKELSAGNQRVTEAPKFSVARGIVERDTMRRKASVLSGATATPILSGEEPDAPTKVESPPLLHEDFIEWSAQYDGPGFNFLHCDFPYGINADKHHQGNAAARGGYADSRDVYFQLLDTLCDRTPVLCTPSAHLMFWFSMDYYDDTVTLLRKAGWNVNLRPLIWFRSDNSGILPDPRRGPRRVYETALMASRGDRLVVQAVADVSAQPNVKSVHMSEKPRPMLRHFFRMFVDEHSRVLDPTCGSGNALRVAHDLGAAFCLGLEKEKEFFDRAVTAWSEEGE